MFEFSRPNCRFCVIKNLTQKNIFSYTDFHFLKVWIFVPKIIRLFPLCLITFQYLNFNAQSCHDSYVTALCTSEYTQSLRHFICTLNNSKYLCFKTVTGFAGNVNSYVYVFEFSRSKFPILWILQQYTNSKYAHCLRRLPFGVCFTFWGA